MACQRYASMYVVTYNGTYIYVMCARVSPYHALYASNVESSILPAQDIYSINQHGFDIKICHIIPPGLEYL